MSHLFHIRLSTITPILSTLIHKYCIPLKLYFYHLLYINSLTGTEYYRHLKNSGDETGPNVGIKTTKMRMMNQYR